MIIKPSCFWEIQKVCKNKLWGECADLSITSVLLWFITVLVSWLKGFAVVLTTSHNNSKSAFLNTGRENRRHRADMAIGGLKVGTRPTGAFRNIFIFFLSPALSFSVFCNFNLPAKYSCCVLSMTVSGSPGLTPGETRTCCSLDSSVSVSLCLRQSDCEYCCTGLNEVPSTCFHVMFLSW